LIPTENGRLVDGVNPAERVVGVVDHQRDAVERRSKSVINGNAGGHIADGHIRDERRRIHVQVEDRNGIAAGVRDDGITVCFVHGDRRRTRADADGRGWRGQERAGRRSHRDVHC
jgi:hypothetical protein